MRVICTMAGILAVAAGPAWVRAQQPEPAGQLIRETVYNELRDHDNHGYWQYWIEQRVQNETRLQEQVETAKKNCPVSQALAATDIKLTAKLVS